MILRTLSMVRKEFLHILRDRRTLFVMFLMPVIQLVLLGYAATTDIEHLRTAVVDGDKPIGASLFGVGRDVEDLAGAVDGRGDIRAVAVLERHSPEQFAGVGVDAQPMGRAAMGNHASAGMAEEDWRGVGGVVVADGIGDPDGLAASFVQRGHLCFPPAG